MKGFLFRKDGQMKLDTENTIFTEKLYKNVNTIRLINPIMSNNIFIFDEFFYRTDSKTRINFYIEKTEEDNIQEDMIIKNYLDYGKIDALNIKNIEARNEELPMLKDEQLILLPGGELIIRTKEPVKEIFISLKWFKESLSL